MVSRMNRWMPLLVLLLCLTWLSPSYALFEKSYEPVSQPSDHKVSLSSKPSRPELGKNSLDIQIRDKAGKPVSDAQVTLTASMPGMKMSTDDDIIQTENKKNGHYAGTVDLSMGGKWQVTVHIKQGHTKEETAVFEFEIKWE